MATTELREFLGQFRAAPRLVGAIAPSSRALAERMVAPVDFIRATSIVELGPGTGSITAAIAPRLADRAQYVGVEIGKAFLPTLARRFPDLAFVHDSAENLVAILASRGMGPVDAVICGLPWASLPEGIQAKTLDAVKASLRPGGLFISFAYLQGLVLPPARILRRRLRAEFTAVETTSIVWGNLPPAFAYVCRR